VRQALCFTLTLALTALFARSAAAGCPNVCDMSLDVARIEPALACAGLKASPQDCDCGVDLDLGNGCESPIEAVDFKFDLCWSPSAAPSSYVRDCTVLPVAEQGSLELKLNATGVSERRLTLQHQGAQHQIIVATNVTSLGDEGCLCSAPGARSGSLGLLAIASALMLVAARRRVRAVP